MSRFNTIVVEDQITNVIEVITPGPPGASSDPVNGGVFVTDITPQSAGENVGNKVYTEDSEALLSCVSTTSQVTVSILAITGHSTYRPVVTANGLPVTLTAIADKPLFTGTVNITLPEDGLITLQHADGATWQTEVETDTPPQVNSAIFFGGYPGSQTELKENDTYQVRISADMDFAQYEIADQDALKYKAGSVSSTASLDVTATIANRGVAVQALGFKVRVRSATGAWSQWYESGTAGDTDGLHKVFLNNRYPAVSFGSPTYPAGQQALKDSETATVPSSADHFDTIFYTSSQLSITNPDTFEATKTVARVSGDYNLANNLTVTATREANNATSTASVAVQIAHISPTLSVSLPIARLRSGGNAGTSAQDYTVTLTATQQLLSAPSITAPHGTLSGAWSGSGTTWHTSIQIHDDDTKGTFAWAGISATNLAGLEVTELSSGASFTIGGFVFRTLTVPAFPNREAAIGTQVVDTAKLECTNLSKGASGSLNYTYQATTDNNADAYTITGGDTWYNCDGANASSNTTGTMQVEIEETV